MTRFLILPLVLLAAACAATPATVAAADRLLFPDDFPGLPAYLALPSTDLDFTDGEWACIPVYRSLDGIPDDFNLLDFLDNSSPDRLAYAQSVPLHVQGFVIRDNPPPSPPQTLYIEDTPGMPVLFVPWDVLQEQAADGEVFIEELLSLDSLLVGEAATYMEEIQVLGGAEVSSHRRVTFGELEDGTPFLATYSHGSAYDVPGVQVHIRFGE